MKPGTREKQANRGRHCPEKPRPARPARLTPCVMPGSLVAAFAVACCVPVAIIERSNITIRFLPAVIGPRAGRHRPSTECAPSTAASPGSFLCGSALANARVPRAQPHHIL